MGCLKLTYHNSFEVDKNYLKKELTANFSKINACSTYQLHDHLGNTRVVYTPLLKECNTNSPTIDYTLDYAADYYPYGKILREFNPKAEKYLTTHHERDTETGLDYRGARYYDADIFRFLSLDPKSSDYPSLSAYSYVAGNPLLYVDPDGRDIVIVANERLTKKFQQVLAQAFDNKLTVTVVKGVVDISHKKGAGAFTKNEYSAYLQLRLVIQSDEKVKLTPVDAASGGEKVRTGQWTTGKIDLDDIKDFGNDDETNTSKGKFVHEAVEQHEKVKDENKISKETGEEFKFKYEKLDGLKGQRTRAAVKKRNQTVYESFKKHHKVAVKAENTTNDKDRIK